MLLADLTTFKIGGGVNEVYFPKSAQEFPAGIKAFGSLSNTLVSSFGYDKPIILTTKMDEIKIDGTRVYAGCGVKGPVLAKTAAEAGLSGFEFMTFPGSVGGMVRMNAGAHGQTISDHLVSVTSIPAVCPPEFSYRSSNLKDAVILGAEFELVRKNTDEIKAKMRENIEFRKMRQPGLTLPNAGSVFKNPGANGGENEAADPTGSTGNFAGALLEQAGCKGLTAGAAAVWDGHANFIVNTGSATSTDVLKLMLMMYNKVADKFGVGLKPEIEYLGSNDEELQLWQEVNKG